MVNVFSFTLFGSDPKYWKGLLKNVELIETKFPNWQIWVSCGDEIPEDVLISLNEHKCVKLIPTHQTGMLNKFYRFFAIDEPSVDICIVRDADSRIFERDEACIREFLESEKLVHIIRDHPNHHHRMMAGMWGIKREAIEECLHGFKLQRLFDQWKEVRPSNEFWSDTEFLCQVIYPNIVHRSLIHDETQNFEPPSFRTPFRVPLTNNDFIGQVYEFSADRTEMRKFPYHA